MLRIDCTLILILAALGAQPSVQALQQPTPDCDAHSSVLPVPFEGTLIETVHFNVPYGRKPCQSVDAFLVASPEPAPVLIDVHGGGWSGGRKSTFFDVYNPTLPHDLSIARALESGISVVSIDYRLAAGKDGCCRSLFDAQGEAIPNFDHMHPIPLDDVAYAIQFVRAMGRMGRWNIDPDRVAGIGISAGANLLLQANLTPDRMDLASPDPILRESSHVDAIVSIVAPTLLTPDTWWSCPKPNQLAEQWVFGGNDPVTFNTDPSLDAIKLSMSPVWLADQAPPIGIGSAGVASVPVLSVYGGDPSWTINDFFPPMDPCSPAPPEALWRPTPNLHSAVHGVLLHDKLVSHGSTVCRLLLDPKDLCTGVTTTRSDRMLSFVADWIHHNAFTGLSHLDPGMLGLNGKHPELGGYGRIRSSAGASIWVADAPQLAKVCLVWSTVEDPQPYLGGTLWPEQGSAIFSMIGTTNDCGHLRWRIPDGTFPPGKITAQLIIEEPGNLFDTLLSAPFELDVEP